MVDAVFRVINDSGKNQIDNVNVSSHMSQKGSVGLSSKAYGAGTIGSASISVNATNPMLAFQCSSPCCLLSSTNNNNSWTFVFASTSTNATVNWWLFDVVNAVGTNATCGIKLWNSAGTLTYATDTSPLRIIGGQDSNNPGNLNLSGGGNYAAVQCSLGWQHSVNYFDGGSGGSGAPNSGNRNRPGSAAASGTATTNSGGVSISGSTASANTMLLETYSLYDETEASSSGGSSYWQYIYVDVTNY